MKPARRRVIAGVMSGTSGDGLDVALVEVGAGRRWRLLGFRHQGYSRRQRERVLRAAAGGVTVAELARLDVWLGRTIGHAVERAAAAAGLGRGAVDLIASHGQTVYHEGGVASLQIGNAAAIAAAAGVAVVSDFRAADVAAGGEGAPLVPWVDYRLFGDARRYRACLNLGGIANLTLLPPGGLDQVAGFDTGPGNMACDALMVRVSGGARGFDRGGKLASAGRVNPELLAEMLRHPFFKRRPPRSAGREQFGAGYVEALVRAHPQVAPADLMATLVELTAQTVAQGLSRGGAEARRAEVIVSGGGVKNPALMRALRMAAPACRWRRVEELGVPGQAKEAIAFALLGEAHVRGEAANLPGVTGASYRTVLGSYTPQPRGRRDRVP